MRGRELFRRKESWEIYWIWRVVEREDFIRVR